MGAMSLRRVRPEDCRQLWEWANDPVTRRDSFSSESIPWATHVEWFEQLLVDPNRAAYIATMNGESVGQIRFDRSRAPAVVSVSIAPEHRGQGLATAVIAAGTSRFLDDFGAD